MAKYTQIKKGDKSEDVSTLQTMLNSLGYNLDVDGSYGGQTEAAVIDYQTKNNLKIDGITGDETWGSLYSTQNAASQTSPSTGTTTTNPIGSYADAQQNYNNLLASKPTEQENPFDQQIQDIYNQIVNREPFSYDMNADAFYQQYKDQYTQQGQLAMMDTMGQAAALTGGYGSSYGQQVGQQAYNQYLQGLNDVLPELEQRAYDRYTDEENALLQQYSMLQGERDYVDEQNLEAYNKWLTELSLAEGERDFLYGVEQDEYAKQQDALALQQSEAADTYNKALALFNAGVDTPEIREAIGIPEDYQFPVTETEDDTPANVMDQEYIQGGVDSNGNIIWYGVTDGKAYSFAEGINPNEYLAEEITEVEAEYDEATEPVGYDWESARKAVGNAPYSEDTIAEMVNSGNIVAIQDENGIVHFEKATGTTEGAAIAAQTPDEVSTKYYQGALNEDAFKYGVMDNGYQPKGISGHGKLNRTSEFVRYSSTIYYGAGAGGRDTIDTSVWRAEDGTLWYWSESRNKYMPLDQNSSRWKMTSLNGFIYYIEN